MKKKFIHLHVHSEYSLEDGLIRIGELAKKTADYDMPAIAITEQGNLFSALKFYRAVQQHGIKPIIGIDIRIVADVAQKTPSQLVLLCQNLQGYRNLNHLITRSYKEGQQYGTPFLQKNWLQGYSQGLIALSGAQQGDIGQALSAGDNKRAKKLLAGWQAIFPDKFYLELQRTGDPLEEKYITAAVTLAAENNVPVVASNNVRFLVKEDFSAHEARVCIQQSTTLADTKRPKVYTEMQYLRSSEEMVQLFSDLPSAIENTTMIAQRCNLELTLGNNYLPEFTVPEGFDQNQWLRKQSEESLGKKIILADDADIDEMQEAYQERLESELSVIIQMDFAGYFLIVADFVQWAKSKNIAVGPGRGSGSGSLVAYVLGITEIDPLSYDLLFERFLNPERVSLPDFDIDFCMERRDEVIDYVAQKYGSDRVSQIITYGRMAAKAVVRDVGRVLNYPYSFVDELAKLIPVDPTITLDRAMKEEAKLKRLYQQETDVSTLIDLAKQLEGISRNAGRHAGGIIISPKSLTDYMPLYYEQGIDFPVSQFDMGDVEEIGLVKFDFLGLKTLTIIASTVEAINKLTPQERGSEEAIVINNIPLDDIAPYKLICNNQTMAIFQLESHGMRQLIKRLQPKNFDDIIALIALFRPGPLQSGMVDEYIERRGGKVQKKFSHPDISYILSATNGVVLYQEQVMKIAQILAGYTLGEADVLRRAMGKKKPDEMAKQRIIFTEKAINRGVQKKVAIDIFNIMEKFAGYGFNKSHSATYALISYQTAWLKSNYPAYFMAAVLSSDMDNQEKITTLVDAIKLMQIKLSPPSVNYSNYKFVVEKKDTIRFGLGAIKGVGITAIREIINARKTGFFADIFNLCNRVDMRKVNKRVIESLICSGATDDLGEDRSLIYASMQKATQLAEQSDYNHRSGQDDFFGLSIAMNKDNANASINTVKWSDHERLNGEKRVLGFYLQGHPMQKYSQELENLISHKLDMLKVANKICTAGYIHKISTHSNNHSKFFELILDDSTCYANVKISHELQHKCNDILRKDTLILIEGKVIAEDFFTSGLAIVANKIYTIETVRERAKILLTLYNTDNANKKLNDLYTMLEPYRNGHSDFSIKYRNDKGQCILNLSKHWKVKINDILLATLREYFGSENVHINYP